RRGDCFSIRTGREREGFSFGARAPATGGAAQFAMGQLIGACFSRMQRALSRPALDVFAAAWIIQVSDPTGMRKGMVTMALGLLGLKVGMTQVYDDKGKLAPVTVLQVGPCPVLQVRSKERDGYDAVQVGFLDKARRKASRAERGHVSADLESK